MSYLFLITKTTFFATMPITLRKVMFGKNYLPLQKAHENFDLGRSLSSPNMFSAKNSSQIYKINIHRLHGKDKLEAG